MKWVTRERPKTDRIPCPWLIRNFIDRNAEFLYVPADQVQAVAEREDAHSYDAPDAEFTHRDGLCSFEVLVEEFKLEDPLTPASSPRRSSLLRKMRSEWAQRSPALPDHGVDRAAALRTSACGSIVHLKKRVKEVPDEKRLRNAVRRATA
jgi:hypothetical protein